MIQNDAEILQHTITEYSKFILGYLDKHNQNMTARNIFAQRSIGADTMIDVATTYDETGKGAQIVAKGGIAVTSGMDAATDNHEMYQIVDAFNINAKDLKLDPTMKKKNVDMLLRHIHKTEDETAINGNSRYGITGMVETARANTNGKITASTNNGKWSGEVGTDIYDDVHAALNLMDEEFEPAMIVGNRQSLSYLTRMDSERKTYAEDIAPLFGKKNRADTSWLWTTKQCPDGYVYVIPKDELAAEFVVSEQPRLVPYPMGPGENYRIEMVSWSAIEFFNNDGFVEIQIT